MYPIVFLIFWGLAWWHGFLHWAEEKTARLRRKKKGGSKMTHSAEPTSGYVYGVGEEPYPPTMPDITPDDNL